MKRHSSLAPVSAAWYSIDRAEQVTLCKPACEGFFVPKITARLMAWERADAMILIKGGRLIDPLSGVDATRDIVIDDGRIADMGSFSRDGERFGCVIEAHGLVVCPGLVDVHVHFRDPGLTYKEDIATGARAAAKGGFTTVVCMANTKPVVDNENTLRYVLDEGKKTGINVLSVAAVTKGMAGRELTDFAALAAAGAAGFSDDGVPVADEALLLMAMKACKALDLPISLHEEHPLLVAQSGVNLGEISQALGLAGASAAAEDVMVARDCMLALHTGARVNIQHVSSKNAVRLIRLAKEMGADIAAEATPHHFTLTEQDVLKHRTLAKVNPPIRTEEDRQAVIQGLRDSTLSLIATDHAPHSPEEKDKGLAEAPSGMIGLETALALGITELVRGGHLSLPALVERMSLNPARLYKLEAGTLSKGKPADMTIFDPDEPWVVSDFASKSRNSPFIGRKVYGRVKYTICGGSVAYGFQP